MPIVARSKIIPKIHWRPGHSGLWWARRLNEAGVGKMRVLLANHPGMVPDVIRELMANNKDIELVGDCRGPMKILQEVGRAKADAVILSLEGPDEPGLCGQLLAIYPDITIVGLWPEKRAFTWQLCSHRREIADAGSENIMRALRTVVRERCTETES